MDKELLFSYNLLTDKIAALQAEAQEQAKQILHQGTKAYFEKYGDTVEQLFWNQYIPWFNDGDTCEFSVGDVYVVLRNDESEDKYSEGSEYDSNIDTYKDALAKWAEFNADPEAYKDRVNAERGGIYFDTRWNTREKYTPFYLSEYELRERIARTEGYPEGFVEATSELMRFISSVDENIMEALFNNHVTVRVTATGIETEDYSHE